MLAITYVYAAYGSVPWIAALFYVLKPVVLAIVALCWRDPPGSGLAGGVSLPLHPAGGGGHGRYYLSSQ